MNPNDFVKQNERGIKRKLELINLKGGKCEVCGYNKNISSLEFHHKNPSEKSFPLDVRHLSNTNIDKLKEEVAKCILLCANCHREIHNPDKDIDNITLILEEMKTNNIKVMGKKRQTQICPNCGKEFVKTEGKIFCSKKCREENKKYPSKETVLEKYEEIKSWQKVADFYGLSRKIIQGIRKKK